MCVCMASVWATEQPGVELEVKVVRVAGVEARPEGGGGGGGGLFVRYYVPAGDGKRRIRVDTREVPCGGGDGEEDGAFWGELARFERRGGGAPASVGGVVFELRWRPRRRSPAFLGMLGTEAVVARAGAGRARVPGQRRRRRDARAGVVGEYLAEALAGVPRAERVQGAQAAGRGQDDPRRRQLRSREGDEVARRREPPLLLQRRRAVRAVRVDRDRGGHVPGSNVHPRMSGVIVDFVVHGRGAS